MVTLKIGYFHSLESLSFHLKNQQTLFLGLFITKTKVKFQFFNLNRGWVNRFGKIIYTAALYIGHFHSPERLSFHLKHQQTLFLGLFRTKRNQVQI